MRRRPAERRPSARSKVTNAALSGSLAWLDGEDKRGPVPRRIADIIQLITTDLGGPTELSEGQRQVIQRIATMSVWCESQEAVMASGEEIDIDRFQRTANSLRRLCESIGLARRARDITPSLEHYIVVDDEEPGQ